MFCLIFSYKEIGPRHSPVTVTAQLFNYDDDFFFFLLIFSFIWDLYYKHAYLWSTSTYGYF